jgi:hypothetical protein
VFKSLCGITLADVTMVIIIALNNVGPGWEVPSNTMGQIGKCSLLLIVEMIFALVSFLISRKKFKSTALSFKIMYGVEAIICLAFLIFSFSVEAFDGQFWFNNFPMLSFLIISITFILILFILSVFYLYKGKKMLR